MLTMPSEIVLDILDQIHRDKLADVVNFHVMGEPTLHKDVVRFCRVAKEKGISVFLVTNGSRLSEEMNKALLDTGLGNISVSLRSPNDEYYAEIFRASKRLDYEAYIDQINSLITESYCRGDDSPTFIVIRVFRRSFSDNLREKAKHQEALYSTGAMISRLRALGERLCGMTAGELRKRYPDRFAAKFYIPVTPRVAIVTNSIMRWWQREADLVNTKYPAVFSYCNGYKDQFAVLADGRVTACCLDYEGHTSLGNVKDRPLKEILHGSSTSEFIGSFNRYQPPTKTCAKCLGGNTIPEWVGRQALAVGRHAASQGLSALKNKPKTE